MILRRQNLRQYFAICSSSISGSSFNGGRFVAWDKTASLINTRSVSITKFPFYIAIRHKFSSRFHTCAYMSQSVGNIDWKTDEIYLDIESKSYVDGESDDNRKTASLFQIFDFKKDEIRYDIDETLLDARFRDLQRVLHPDVFATASDVEKKISLHNSTNVNRAYQILKDDVKRAVYLLKLLYQVEIFEDGEICQDNRLMMEIFELREKIEDLFENVKRIKNDSEPGQLEHDEAEKELDALFDEVKSNVTAAKESLLFEFQNGNVDAIQQKVIQLKYYTKARDEIYDLLENPTLTK